MPIWIPVIIGAVAVASYLNARSGPKDRVALVGPTSAGKSLLGNDLLGWDAFDVDAGHGTTRSATAVELENGWSLVDTPGLLDGQAFADEALEVALSSRVIVLCTDGELLRPVVEWLDRFAASVQRSHRVSIIPVLTKEDLRERVMPTRDREKIRSRLAAQIDAIDARLGANVLVDPVMAGRIDDRDAIAREIRNSMAWTSRN